MHTFVRGSTFAAAVVLASSCASEHAPTRGQSGTEGSYQGCAERVSGRPVGPDEPLEEGFTARELARFAEGTFEVPLHWRDKPRGDGQFLTEHETNARLSMVPNLDTARRIAWREATNDNPCADTLEMSGTLVLMTEDGAFDEVLPVQLRGRPRAASASADISPKELRGTYDASFFEAKEPVISIRVRFGLGRGDAETATSGYGTLGESKPSTSGEQQAAASILEW